MSRDVEVPVGVSDTVAAQGIQRYDNAEHDAELVPVADGEYVAYVNHVAALKAAETISSAVIADFQRQAREQGVSDERKRIRFAIAALVDNDVIDLSLSEYRAVVEAIDEEKP